jgi:hypothetical protein
MTIRKPVAASCLLLLSGLSAVGAEASPVVTGLSGTLSNGQSITITGSAFGTKAQAAPLLYDDFENHSAGGVVAGNAAKIGTWDVGDGANYVTYTNVKAHSGSGAAKHDFISTYNASLSKNGSFPTLYMDFWVMVDYVDVITRNWKPWRLYGNNDNLQLDYAYLCNGQLDNTLDLTNNWAVGYWGGNSYNNHTWMHVQLVYTASTPGVADGTVEHFIDSVPSGLNSTAVTTRQTNYDFDQIRIGHYWAQDAVTGCAANSGATVYTDNVYIDTTWARVEIGDAATYAGSTHREIQVPSAWTSNSATVQLNAGSFAPGTKAYLYVTDSNNNTSSGYPITIGGTAVVAKPASNLVVQ